MFVCRMEGGVKLTLIRTLRQNHRLLVAPLGATTQSSPRPGSRMRYRIATQADVDAMGRIRTEGGWEEGAPAERMGLYLAGKHHPQHALPPRTIYVAEDEAGAAMLGFVAGHLTTRYSCDGELQWIYVLPDQRGSGIASGLLRQMTEWFLSNSARRICVNVDPRNLIARRFYVRNGAQELNEYWMVWPDIRAALVPSARA